jgi:hypothetical protein
MNSMDVIKTGKKYMQLNTFEKYHFNLLETKRFLNTI